MTTLNLNGKDVSLPQDPRTTLLDFLHQHLFLKQYKGVLILRNIDYFMKYPLKTLFKVCRNIL